MQLEKALQNSGGAHNSTLTAILETKDARIATLEREVKLLEQELDRHRDLGIRETFLTSPLLDPIPHSYHSQSHAYQQTQTGYKHQVSEEERSSPAADADAMLVYVNTIEWSALPLVTP